MTTIDAQGNVHDASGQFGEKHQAPAAAAFPAREKWAGFMHAARLMDDHQDRAATHGLLRELVADPRVTHLAVDAYSRSDKIYVTAYTADGERLNDVTFYVEGDDRFSAPPSWQPEGLDVESDSMVDPIWVDAQKLRDYDLDTDRQATQEAVIHQHLLDMAMSGNGIGALITQRTCIEEAQETAAAASMGLTDEEIRSAGVGAWEQGNLTDDLFNPVWDRMSYDVRGQLDSIMLAREEAR